jgi:hypothetical protein
MLTEPGKKLKKGGNFKLFLTFIYFLLFYYLLIYKLLKYLL